MNDADRPPIDALLAVAREAVDAVVGDLQRTTSLRPRVSAEVWMESAVRITVKHGFTAPSLFATAKHEALAELADYLPGAAPPRTWS